jgi:hypothetical protein
MSIAANDGNVVAAGLLLAQAFDAWRGRSDYRVRRLPADRAHFLSVAHGGSDRCRLLQRRPRKNCGFIRR